MATTRDIEIMKTSYQKLDNMVLSFGLPAYSNSVDVDRYLGIDLKDTLRELKIKDTDNIETMSMAEMRIEDRIVYHAIRRFRNSASVFFKFSTATDGKTVDKRDIPKMLIRILEEYDKEWKQWRMSLPNDAASIWNRTKNVATSGDYSGT